MGPLPKSHYDYPLLPLDERDNYDEEPNKAALDSIEEKLRVEFEGEVFEPASPPGW